MLYRNKKLDDAFEFIAHTDFDVFCLQEVPEPFLARLQTLPYSLISRIGTEKLVEEDVVRMFNVILSRHPITAQGEVPFPEYWERLPLRTRLFITLMPDRLFSKMRDRGCLYADISLGATSVRIFNLHLMLAQPVWRLEEFEIAMMKRDPSRTTIVCGDFNILEKPHITLLNWILGGRVSDALFYKRERARIEQCFVAHELQNPLRGKSTHPLSRSQLDHILVSKSLSIKSASVIPNRYGSDHHPIFVETR